MPSLSVCTPFMLRLELLTDISKHIYMRKLLLVIFCCFTVLTVSAQGKVYTEQLVITINDATSEPQTTNVVVVDNGDGTINFEMKNFFMVDGENSIPVGNIVLEKLPVTEGENGLKLFTFNSTLAIQPGDLEGVDFWVGPAFGEIPLDLRGKMTNDKMYAVIDIDIREAFGQILFVQFGTDDFSENQDTIDNITSSQRSSAAVYDLSGRRVEKPSHGIYVVGGKKVMF